MCLKKKNSEHYLNLVSINMFVLERQKLNLKHTGHNVKIIYLHVVPKTNTAVVIITSVRIFYSVVINYRCDFNLLRFTFSATSNSYWVLVCFLQRIQV
jgi:hypothetical protein